MERLKQEFGRENAKKQIAYMFTQTAQFSHANLATKNVHALPKFTHTWVTAKSQAVP